MSSGDPSRGLDGLGGTAAVPPVGDRVAGLAPDSGLQQGPRQRRPRAASWPPQRPPPLVKAHRCFNPVGDPPHSGARTWGRAAAGGRRCPQRSLPQRCGGGVGTGAGAPRTPPGLGARAGCCPGSGHSRCAVGEAPVPASQYAAGIPERTPWIEQSVLTTGVRGPRGEEWGSERCLSQTCGKLPFLVAPGRMVTSSGCGGDWCSLSHRAGSSPPAA